MPAKSKATPKKGQGTLGAWIKQQQPDPAFGIATDCWRTIFEFLGGENARDIRNLMICSKSVHDMMRKDARMWQILCATRCPLLFASGQPAAKKYDFTKTLNGTIALLDGRIRSSVKQAKEWKELFISLCTNCCCSCGKERCKATPLNGHIICKGCRKDSSSPFRLVSKTEGKKEFKLPDSVMDVIPHNSIPNMYAMAAGGTGNPIRQYCWRDLQLAKMEEDRKPQQGRKRGRQSLGTSTPEQREAEAQAKKRRQEEAVQKLTTGNSLLFDLAAAPIVSYDELANLLSALPAWPVATTPTQNQGSGSSASDPIELV